MTCLKCEHDGYYEFKPQRKCLKCQSIKVFITPEYIDIDTDEVE